MNTKTALLVLATFATLGAAQLSAQNPARPQNQDRKQRIEKFLNEHPDIKAKVDSWRALTPDQRKEKIQQKKAEMKALTPEERKAKMRQFGEEHPGIKEMIRHFLSRHAGLKKMLMKRFVMFGADGGSSASSGVRTR
ncbi:MAG: hypothetical protein HY286_08230 [Planctomycetes bacterium]|nr:hypothetical protein [Planctomycetota bacterium]